jgi:uncharacterized protein
MSARPSQRSWRRGPTSTQGSEDRTPRCRSIGLPVATTSTRSTPSSTPGAVIADGTPLTDATAFGQWNAARRLVERGARTPLREAAALGLMDRVEQYCSGDSRPSSGELTQALWYACHGGQKNVAEYLLDLGAELNWISTWDGLTPLDAARRSEAHELAEWLQSRGAKSANDPT